MRQRPIQHIELTMLPIIRKIIKFTIVVVCFICIISCNSSKSFFKSNDDYKYTITYKEIIPIYGYNYYKFHKEHIYAVKQNNHKRGLAFGKWELYKDTLYIYEPTVHIQSEYSGYGDLDVSSLEIPYVSYRQYVVKKNKLIECTDHTKFLKYDSPEDSIQHYQKDLEDALYLNEHVQKYNYMTRVRQ